MLFREILRELRMILVLRMSISAAEEKIIVELSVFG